MPKRPPSHALPPRILVNYQPDDSAPHARKLLRMLRRRFGDQSVETSTDPLSHVLSSTCDFGAGRRTVLLVVIGKRWRTEEATTAVSLAAHEIIPVLVDGASPPTGIAFRRAVDLSPPARAVRLRDDRWEKDFEKLAAAIEHPRPRETDVTGAHTPSRVRRALRSSNLIELRISREAAMQLLTSLIFLGAAGVGGKKGGKPAEDKLSNGYVRFTLGGGKGYYRVPVGGKGKGGDARSAARASAADVVACTVYAPPRVSRGELFMVQVWAHLPEEAREASRLAQEADADAERRATKTLDAEVERGSRLTFDLSIPGMEVEEPRQSLVWRGSPEAVQFSVFVPDAHRAGNVHGTVVVSQGSVPFGHVTFKIKVAAAGAADSAAARVGAELVRYHKAFISYASKDRNEVLKRVQMLALVKLDFFQDLLSLDPGERWAQSLYKHIDESDVFLLFWSTSARDSEWVMREVRYALDRKGRDESAPPKILPVIIEGPPPVAPPPDLAHLHFNDKILYFIIDDEEGRG